MIPRYCDDGWRCPGHPNWTPWFPRLQLYKLRAPAVMIKIGGGK